MWTAVDGSEPIVAANAWHNALHPFDVNGDGLATPADVLMRINYLNAHPDGSELRSAASLPDRYDDVNGDGACTAQDVLAAINHLNVAAAAVAEGEAGAKLPGKAGQLAASPRDQIFRNLQSEMSPLDDVLVDLAEDIASAWIGES